MYKGTEAPTNGHEKAQRLIRRKAVSCFDLVEVTADNQLAAVAIARQVKVKPLRVCIVLLLLV